jgi:Zn-dependent alcohol dehydrogenase
MPKRKTFSVVWDGGLAVNAKIGRLSVTGTVDQGPAAAVFSLADIGLASMAEFSALPDKEKRRLICRQLAQGHVAKVRQAAPGAVKVVLDVLDEEEE